MHDLVDRIEFTSEVPASIQQKLLELALELRTVGGKKQYGYLKKPLKDKVDDNVDDNVIRWLDTKKTWPFSRIRSRSRKNFAPSRMPSFRKRNACGSRWSKRREHQNKNLPRRLHPLTWKLHRTLLQIRRLQMKKLRLWLLILRGFRPNIF